MKIARTKHSKIGIAAWFIALFVCVSSVSAVSDGAMLRMPGPPSSAIYWQLTRIDQTPEVTPASGYQVDYQAAGLSIDLTDPLMAESLLDKGEPSYQPEVNFSISKDEETLIEHQYTWTAPPIYMEPGGVYPITVKSRANHTHNRLNSRVSPYVLDEPQGRASADGYNNYPDSLTFNITTDDLLRDGRIITSIVIRDEHEMFKYRVDYTYEMKEGAKPRPTPFPGFLPVDLVRGGAPAYYDEVPGVEGLWRVTTAPDEYRAFGSMNGGEPRFYPADAEGNVEMGVRPADLTDDFMSYVQGFVPTTPAEVPPWYHEITEGVYGFTSRDGRQITRAHGRVDGAPDAFYPMVGDPAVVSTIEGPVDPEQDFVDFIDGFGAAIPPEAVSHYQQSGNVYSFTGRDGFPQHRVYGRLNGAEPAYYPSTEDGTIISEVPVDPQTDFDAYIKGFDAAEPAAIPKYYRQADEGLYYVLERDGTPQYRVFGVLDGEAPAFYPADASGNRLEGAPPVLPEDDFDAYIAGFEPGTPADVPQFYNETDVPGVWAFQDVDGQTHYRAYGSLNRGEPAFFPSDAEGNAAVDALPVNPASDLLILPPPPVFSAVTPDNPPDFYAPVQGYPGVYSFVDENGDTAYRVYGGYDDEVPAFYPSNASGEMVEDAEPVNVEDDELMLPKPSATPITFVLVTKSPDALPARQVVRNFMPRPAATPAAYSFPPAPEATASMSPVSRTVISPAPTPNTAYSILPTHAPTLSPTALTRLYTAAPSPTPFAFEIVRESVPSPTKAPTVVRVYTSPSPTPYVSTVKPTSAAPEATPAGVRRTSVTPRATPYTSFISPTSAAPEATPESVQRTSDAVPLATAYTSTVTPVSSDVPATPESVQRTMTATVGPLATGAGTAGPEDAVTVDVSITPIATQIDVETAVPGSGKPTEIPSGTAMATEAVPTTMTPGSSAAVGTDVLSGTGAPSGTGAATETGAPSQTDRTSEIATPASDASPSGTEIPSETEVPTSKETEEAAGNNTWMIPAGISLAAILGYVGYRLTRRKK